MRTAIDSNILSALWGGEPTAPLLAGFLREAGAQGGLVISPVVYVELAAHPDVALEFLDRFMNRGRIEVDWAFGEEIWKLAAERFAQFTMRRRRQGEGQPKRMAADFMIAAHALLRADRFVTLDQRRYRTDFPELTLVEL